MAAVKKVLESPELRCVPYNLGTGTGEWHMWRMPRLAWVGRR